jgi:hypothetical protein
MRRQRRDVACDSVATGSRAASYEGQGHHNVGQRRGHTFWGDEVFRVAKKPAFRNVRLSIPTGKLQSAQRSVLFETSS